MRATAAAQIRVNRDFTHRRARLCRARLLADIEGLSLLNQAGTWPLPTVGTSERPLLCVRSLARQSLTLQCVGRKRLPRAKHSAAAIG